MLNTIYIVWHPENDTGISIIDEQHRSIVSTINTFHYLVRQDMSDQAIESIINILKQYTRLHFLTEEGLMNDAQYPHLDDHKELHHALSVKTMQIALNSEHDPNQILTFLKEWWLTHINKEDKRYIPYVKKILT